jgi:RimJ/RimL family protein N-acetyltransferase
MATTIPSTSTPVSIEISTTKPSHITLPAFSSQRLTFRPLLASDFPAYLSIYQTETHQTQSESFIHATQEYFLQRKLTTYAMLGIFLKTPKGTEGELIGDGGVFFLDNKDEKWPEIYYVLRKDFWNKGYATEFLQAFLGAWWRLPRENTCMRVQPVVSLGNLFYHQDVKEQLGAEIRMDNTGSVRVVEKAGFEFCGHLDREHRCGYWLLVRPD